MRIGIDLDDTIASFFEIFLNYAIMYDKSLKKNVLSLTKQKDKEFSWNNFEKDNFYRLYIDDIAGSLFPLDGASNYISKLKEDGHEILVVSARNKKHYSRPYELTSAWLKKHKIPFDQLHIGCENKMQLCLDYKIDLFIDDNITTLNLIKDKGIPTILIETKLNKKQKTNHNRFVSWQEIYKAIKKINS